MRFVTSDSANCWATSQPDGKGKEQAGREERAEDMLVVLRQPQRKINVEIVLPVGRVARGHTGQRASHPVYQQDETLQRHQRDQRSCRDPPT